MISQDEEVLCIISGLAKATIPVPNAIEDEIFLG